MHMGKLVVSEAAEVPGERGELEDLVELESKMAANILLGQRNKQGEIWKTLLVMLDQHEEVKEDRRVH